MLFMQTNRSLEICLIILKINPTNHSKQSKRKHASGSDNETVSELDKTDKPQQKRSNLPDNGVDNSNQSENGTVTSNKVVTTAADVHVDSSLPPDVLMVTQLITRLSVDMRAMFDQVNIRINSLETNLGTENF